MCTYVAFSYLKCDMVATWSILGSLKMTEAPFLENKIVDQRLGANSKKKFFAQFYSKFATFCIFFSFLAQ